MKIIQVHNHYTVFGGEDKMFGAISRILRHKGHSVRLFERSSRDLIGLKGKTSAFVGGIYSISAKRAFSKILSAESPDIVHVHNLFPLISPSILVACREFNVPVVMCCPNYKLICPTSLHLRNGTVCEMCCGAREYWCILKNCRNNIFESVGYALRTAVARNWRLYQDNVTLYVPPTEFVKRRLVHAGFPENRVIVIPNMVPLPESGVNGSGGEYVAYAGRISPEKGINTLLEAARQTELHVCLAGDYSQVLEIVKKAPQNVQFIGHMNRGQLDEFYRNARFSAVPSVWFEAFGLVAAEAMSYGLPVIASKIGGLVEIIDDGVTGSLFEAGNAKELADKMKLLWKNPDLCRQMGVAGREKVIQEYSEDVYYQRIMDVYRKAIQMNKR